MEVSELDINIYLGLSDYKNIPKLLFPFNEHYLMFAVAEDLEKQGVKHILEPAIPISREYPIKIHGINFPELGFETKTSMFYPDIFIPEYGFFIEVENFYNPDPLEHFYEYLWLFEENSYPFYGCALTWKCKKLVESPDLYFVDPITGKTSISVIKGEPVKIQMDENSYPTGKPHTWVQYELFR
ncbi:hypothetical protein Asulf_01723 [Archaeoglobus sulfaticallidus PM70-1]|uniref:Uncharacterized protein n=1 Tax=Archaeoglobus sulfaticallidus PM70-1 TaxID=387631 RepID=N0BDI4_9EURY|nr:hypothetical protein [Archaeoglobus sulfaticallidus]AGK61694.1 hypothetical protein Asulf_01723 [Archaeoglobus sulfaticallidus PM70-1]